MPTTQRVRDDLDRLLELEDEFDSSFLRPTEYAIRTARDLVHSAAALARRQPVQEPRYSTIGDGSLGLRWRNGARLIHVLVPDQPGAPCHLRHEDAAGHGHAEASPAALAAWLDWLGA